MTETVARRHAAALIRDLSPKKLKVAVEFLSYLQTKEDWEPTLEILQSPSLVRSIKRGQHDIRRGRWVKWSDVKRRV